MSTKTWGPFTGSQLTIIIVAVALCFAIPGGLWASGLQFSFVSLYDAKSKQSAKLGAGGAIKVTNGVGPLVVGETAPASLVRFYHGVPSACDVYVTAPPTSAIILKEVSLSVAKNAAAEFGGIVLHIGPPSDPCGGSAVASVSNPSLGLVSFPLGPGWAIPAGLALTGFPYGTPMPSMTIFGTGYLVPAAAVPAATAVTVQSRGGPPAAVRP